MPECPECGHENKEGNKYCINCGSEIELTQQELTARVVKESAERQQKSFYVLSFFLLFAVIDFVAAYDFPLILFSGLLIDAIICAFLWFTWLG